MVSPLHFLRKLRRRVTSRPEIEISDKRLAFSSQTSSIEPSYKTGPKQVKMSISPIAQGFLKIFRVQNVALTVRRPKHPSLVWCILIFLYETFSRLIPRDPNLAHHRSKLPGDATPVFEDARGRWKPGEGCVIIFPPQGVVNKLGLYI